MRVAKIVLAFLLCLFCSACVSSGGIGILDDMKRYPQAQELMNNAMNKAIAEIDFEKVKGKSVQIEMAGGMKMKYRDEKGNLIKSYQNMDMDKFLHGFSWKNYFKSACERKLSEYSAKSVAENADLQLVVNPNNVGLQRRIFYFPFILFLVWDIYRHRVYWVLFDVTIDLKSGDGTQVLDSKRIKTESDSTTKISVFRSSLLFGD